MSVSDAEPLGLALALGLGSESSNPTHSSNASETLETLYPKLNDLRLEDNREEILDGWDQDFTANEQNDDKKLESLNEEMPIEENEEKWGWNDEVGAVEENVKLDKGFPREQKGRNIELLYPARPDEPNCAYYMKTAMCKYGLNCKFNHPASWMRNKVNFRKGLDPVQVVESGVNGTSSVAVGQTGYEAYKGMRRGPISESNGQMACKYFSFPGGCMYGNACKYIHKEKTEVLAELNFLGLPMRPGEKECTYYMSTGSCKFSTNCRFHHPNPTAVGGQGSSGYQHGGSQPYASPAQPPVTPWPVQQIPNTQVPYFDTAPSYAAGYFLPPQGLHPNSESNGYLTPVTPLYSVPPMEEYPERPGQAECQFFMKTGACKFKSACKYHHPKSRLPRTSDVILSPVGLPLRPDQPTCMHFSCHGICKFGRSCRYNHPMDRNPLAVEAKTDGIQVHESEW